MKRETREGEMLLERAFYCKIAGILLYLVTLIHNSTSKFLSMKYKRFIERTALIVKPDGVRRGLVGEVIGRVERMGLKVVGLKMVRPTRAHIDDFYPKSEEWMTRLGEKSLKTYKEYKVDPKKELGTDKASEIGKKVREWILETWLAGAPVVVLAVEGVHAITHVRGLVGSTMPTFAQPGTIRGDYSIDSAVIANLVGRAVKNLVHASETPEEAKHELEHWFAPEQLFEYKRADEAALLDKE
jgi:nucleoside-diphosphate kinase